MPEYLEPLHGVSLSEAYAEAIAVAPIQRVMFDTLEMRHSEFRDDLGLPYAIRIVCAQTDFAATLEAGAPFNANTTVLFQALPIDVSGPDESDSGEAPAISISIDGVSQHVVGQLDLAVQTLEPVLLTWRVYASDDTSGPAMLPVVTMTLRDVEVGETRITAKATFQDPTNQSFPRKTYGAEYPGLSAS